MENDFIFKSPGRHGSAGVRRHWFFSLISAMLKPEFLSLSILKIIQDILKYILLKYFHLEWKFHDQFIAYTYNFHKNPQKLNFEQRKILLQCILFHILTLCAALVILNLCILEFVIKALVYFRGPWENVLILWQFLIFYWFKSQLSPT